MTALQRYGRGADDLDAALMGITGDTFDLVAMEGEWSIRAIVHHLADVELRQAFWWEAAIANPGVCLSVDWRHPHLNRAWGAALGFATRPVAPSLAMIRQVRVYIVSFMAFKPHALGHPFTLHGADLPEPIHTTVGHSIWEMAGHLDEHLAEIRRIRTLHGA